jgi:hypothetical protein
MHHQALSAVLSAIAATAQSDQRGVRLAGGQKYIGKVDPFKGTQVGRIARDPPLPPVYVDIDTIAAIDEYGQTASQLLHQQDN